MRREVSRLSTITCIPSPCGGGLGWGSPLLKPKRGVRAKGKHEVAGFFLAPFAEPNAEGRAG